MDGRVVYEEGVLVGYRHYETNEVAPLFAFGHGLCYGDVVWESVDIDAGEGHGPAGNKGPRRGTEVVQVYLRRARCARAAARPRAGGVREGRAGSGRAATVEVGLGAVAYRYWDVDTHGWRSDAGRYEVLVGASSRDIRASAVVTGARSAA